MSFQVSSARRPDQIPGCTLWLDAGYAPSLSFDPVSGSVASWTTRDASARVFSPVNTSQEFYKLIRTRKKGWTKPVVCMTNSANTGLASASYDIASNFAANGTDITIAMALRSDDVTTTFGTVFYHYISTTLGHYFRLNNSVGNVRYLCLSTAAFIAGVNTSFVGNYNVIRLQRSGNTLKCWINGALVQTVASTATPIPVGSNAPMYLNTQTTSGGQGMIGDLPMMSMHNRALSDAEGLELDNYYFAHCLGIN